MHTRDVDCVVELRFPVAVARVHGRLDEAGASTVRGTLLKCLADQPSALVLDLSGLTVADDRALRLLPELARRAAEWPGTELLLSVPDPETAAALDRAGVTKDLQVFGAREEALAAAARRPVPRRLRQQLPPVMDAPEHARTLIARAAASWRLSGEAVQIAQLIATELVSNAVVHARTAIEFSVVLWDRYLHLAVADGSPQPPRRRTVASDRADRGRGLQVVDGVARSWGCVSMPEDGKVVWATVRVHT